MVVELLECVMCYISVFFIITGLPQANPWPTPKASGATLNSEMLNVIAHGRHGDFCGVARTIGANQCGIGLEAAPYGS